MNTWVLGGDFLDGTNGFKSVTTGFFLTGGNRESKRIHDDVFHPHVPLGNKVTNQPRSDSNLVSLVSGLTLFVNGQRNHGCTVFFNNRHDLCKARIWPIAVFEIHGVHNRSSTD